MFSTKALQRSVLVPAASVIVTSLLTLAATACTIDKDETGGRPVEVATTPGRVTGTDSSSGDVKPSPVTPPPTYQEGETAFREGRYEEATLLFTSYVESRPENPWGHYMLGLSAWKAGDLESARKSLERSLEMDRKSVKGLLNLTRVLLDLDQPKEAREQVSKALALDSTLAEGHRLMGRVQSSLKRHNEAMLSYRIALSLDPEDVWSMNNLGHILLLQARYDEALPPLARATQLKPDVAVFQNNLGTTLERKGNYGLAREAYRAAVGADSTYMKAVQSLARLEGWKDDPSVSAVDLVAVAGEFDKDVRSTPISQLVTRKP
jgi:Tfp pilus assembly protein PilF